MDDEKPGAGVCSPTLFIKHPLQKFEALHLNFESALP
jgi:hypothetical protein